PPLSFFAKTMLILLVRGTVEIDDTSVQIINMRNIVEPYIFNDFCIKSTSALPTHNNLSLLIFIQMGCNN
ncbi:MAG TPA: hypothetical protein VH500_03795, partial [Nitrososphaeraceae archaeon]